MTARPEQARAAEWASLDDAGAALLRIQQERVALTEDFMRLRGRAAIGAREIEAILLRVMRLRRATDAAKSP